MLMFKNSPRPAFIFGAVLFGSVFALIIAESALRLAGFEFDLYPTKVQFGWPDPVTIVTRYQADQQLLWVPRGYYSTLDSAVASVPTVVFMGDSCTEFGRYDQHLGSLVTKRYREADFSYVNMGVGGWSSYQGLVQMRRDIVRIQPSIVTVYFGWNDHWRSYGIADKDIGEFYESYPPLLLALSRARVVQLIKKGLFALRLTDDGNTSEMPERVSLADFESNLTSIVQIARHNGIKPVLITAPTSHERGREPAYLVPRWLNDLEDLVPLHQKYAQVVREVSARHQVMLVDLHAEFKSMSRDERDSYFNDDGIHLNEKGNRRVAEMLLLHFRRHDLLQPPNDRD